MVWDWINLYPRKVKTKNKEKKEQKYFLHLSLLQEKKKLFILKHSLKSLMFQFLEFVSRLSDKSLFADFSFFSVERGRWALSSFDPRSTRDFLEDFLKIWFDFLLILTIKQNQATLTQCLFVLKQLFIWPQALLFRTILLFIQISKILDSFTNNVCKLEKNLLKNA